MMAGSDSMVDTAKEKQKHEPGKVSDTVNRLKSHASKGVLDKYWFDRRANTAVEHPLTANCKTLEQHCAIAIDQALKRVALAVVASGQDYDPNSAAAQALSKDEQESLKKHVKALQSMSSSRQKCSTEQLADFDAMKTYKMALDQSQVQIDVNDILERTQKQTKAAHVATDKAKETTEACKAELTKASRGDLFQRKSTRRSQQSAALQKLEVVQQRAQKAIDQCGAGPISGFEARQSFQQAAHAMHRQHSTWSHSHDTSGARRVELTKPTFAANGCSSAASPHPKTKLAKACVFSAKEIKKTKKAGNITKAVYETHYHVAEKFDTANADLATAKADLQKALHANTDLLVEDFSQQSVVQLNQKYTAANKDIQKKLAAYKKAAADHRAACVALYYAANLGHQFSVHPAALALLRDQEASDAVIAGLPHDLAQKMTEARNDYHTLCNHETTIKIKQYDKQSGKTETVDLGITAAELPEFIEYMRENDPEFAGWLAEFTQAMPGDMPLNSLLEFSIGADGELKIDLNYSTLKKLLDKYETFKSDYEAKHPNASREDVEVAYMRETGIRAPFRSASSWAKFIIDPMHTKRALSLTKNMGNRMISSVSKFNEAKKASEGSIGAHSGKRRTPPAKSRSGVTVSQGAGSGHGAGANAVPLTPSP